MDWKDGTFDDGQASQFGSSLSKKECVPVLAVSLLNIEEGTNRSGKLGSKIEAVMSDSTKIGREATGKISHSLASRDPISM